MTTMLMERLPGLAPVDDGRASLDDLLAGLWDELSHGHPASCPLCDGTMRPLPRQLGRPVEARCEECHTALS